MSNEQGAVRHLTAEEVGERLRIPKHSVYELVKKGHLPALHIGRRIRFRVADVEAWEAAGGSPPKPKAEAARRSRR